MEIQLPSVGANRRQRTVTAVIEEGIRVLVSGNHLFPFQTGIPRTPERNGCVQRQLLIGTWDNIALTKQQRAEITAVNNTGTETILTLDSPHIERATIPKLQRAINAAHDEPTAGSVKSHATG